MSSKKLTLNKETLRTLGAEASEVAGGGLYQLNTIGQRQCVAMVSAVGICLDNKWDVTKVINPDPINVSVVSVVSFGH